MKEEEKKTRSKNKMFITILMVTKGNLHNSTRILFVDRKLSKFNVKAKITKINEHSLRQKLTHHNYG